MLSIFALLTIFLAGLQPTSARFPVIVSRRLLERQVPHKETPIRRPLHHRQLVQKQRRYPHDNEESLHNSPKMSIRRSGRGNYVNAIAFRTQKPSSQKDSYFYRKRKSELYQKYRDAYRKRKNRLAPDEIQWCIQE